MLAGAAGLGVLTFLLDTKTFLGDVQTEEDFYDVQAHPRLGEGQSTQTRLYTPSVESDYHSCLKHPEMARDMMKSFERRRLSQRAQGAPLGPILQEWTAVPYCL